MNPPTHCLECQAPLTPAETQGLCARCLLKLGLASQLAATSSLPASPANSGPPPVMPFQFGEYRIERLLGKGGMGAVYEAEDLTSGRRVALKALGHSLDSPDTRRRFLREGRLAASINHPNSVYVYGTEEIEGAPVITMEVIPGGTLQERVKAEGPMAVTAAVDAILQIIAGLEAAHAVGILHRDIKPSNCFIDPSGSVKVGDFGLSISTTSRGDSALTMAGSVLGTPEFSSPEQLRGEALDLRADIYSVGMTLYYLLTGRTAFQAANVVQLLATVLDKPAPSPRTLRPEIPEELARAVLRCVAKQAGDRFKNYDELRRALLPFTSTSPTPATLGLRFIAGVIDNFTMSTVIMGLSVLLFGGLMDVTDPVTLRSAQWVWFSFSGWLFQIAYFGVPEGLWGASVGKALMGLRVGDANRNAPGILRASGRAAIYLVSALLSMLAFLLFYRRGSPVVPSMAWGLAFNGIHIGYLLFLASTARRRNGFATVTDLLTKTRVIQKSAYEPRTAVAQIEEPVAGTEALPQIGPYHVLATLATGREDHLVLAYDTKLLRRVWIRKTPGGAAPVPSALRNAARPGRLRWLQGHRDDEESWDAYEAVPGTPLANLLRIAQPWKSVRNWLFDLAAELGALPPGSPPAGPFSLDHVWITADGRLKLLDFAAPGADQAAAPIADPALFLNQLAISALEGRVVSPVEAGASTVRVPVPIPARSVLRDLRQTVDFPAVARQLQALTHLVPEVSRRRRFGLIAGCVVPAMMAFGIMLSTSKMFQKWEQQAPEVWPLLNALEVDDMMSKGAFPKKVDRKTGLEAAKTFIAGRFGKFIRDPQAWNSTLASTLLPPARRAQAERIVAAHPHPTEAEMAAARVTLAHLIDRRGNLSPVPDLQDGGFFSGDDFPSSQLVWIGSGGVFIWAAVLSLVAALLFRGGLLLRAFGIDVVRRDGANASRLRMLWRACVAWSWMPLGVLVFSLLKPATGWPGALGIVAPVVVAVVAWSAVRPGRSLQDLLAGTWLVPR
jgi:hypothetical protein